MPKLYMGRPSTITSAWRSSSISSSEKPATACCSGVRASGLARNDWKRSAVRCGTGSAPMSRTMTRPFGLLRRHSATNFSARRLDCPPAENMLVWICRSVFIEVSVVGALDEVIIGFTDPIKKLKIWPLPIECFDHGRHPPDLPRAVARPPGGRQRRRLCAGRREAAQEPVDRHLRGAADPEAPRRSGVRDPRQEGGADRRGQGALPARPPPPPT